MIPVNLGEQLIITALKIAGAETSSTNGATAADLELYEGEVGVVLNAHHGTGNSDNTLALKLQGSADGSTSWADISGATFTSVNGTTDSVQLLSLNKDACARYVRYVSTLGGTSPSFDYALSIVGIKKYADGA